MYRHRTPSTAIVPLLLVLVAGCGEPPRPAEEPAAPAAPVDGVHGRAPAPVGGVPALILLQPRSGEVEAGGVEPSATEATTAEPPMMDQLGLAFTPRWLVARPGQPVAFRNSESVAHNVHVRFAENDSTVFYRDTQPQETTSFTFDTVGPYDVTCDTHPGMTAFIFVTTARYATFAERDRTFHIPGVAPGEYTLTFWSLDPSARSEQPITVREGSATEVSGPMPGA